MYLYKNEIRHIHEFIADEEAANLMPSKSDYALLLFSNILGINPNQLSNNFFNKSLLKRRLIMLNKNRSHKTGLWKYGFSFPLFALMLIFSAATASSDNNILSIDAKKNLPILDIISKPENNNISLIKESVSTASVKKASGDTQALKKHVEGNIKYPKSVTDRDTIPSGKKNEIVDFASVEVLPEFQDGIKGWIDYLKANLKYPEEAKKNKITGRVIMSFVVDKTGSLEDIKVLRGVEKSLDEEALRILRTSPKWKPGIQNGRPVKVAYTMPIFFQLAPKASEEKTN
jgi:TonB family protein